MRKNLFKQQLAPELFSEPLPSLDSASSLHAALVLPSYFKIKTFKITVLNLKAAPQS